MMRAQCKASKRRAIISAARIMRPNGEDESQIAAFTQKYQHLGVNLTASQPMPNAVSREDARQHLKARSNSFYAGGAFPTPPPLSETAYSRVAF